MNEDYGQYTIDLKITNPGGFKADSSGVGAIAGLGIPNPNLHNPLSFLKPPEGSEWQCYLFGNRPGSIGMVYRPGEGRVPNWFARWSMRIFFDCLWVKDKPKPEEQRRKIR